MKAKNLPDARQRILDTAARLFYRQGYGATGINQLIAEAGVAKASLYQHFATKDEVLKAYLEQTSRDWLAQVEAAAATGTTPREQVLAVFDLLNGFLTDVEFRGCNFQNALVQLAPEETEVRSFIQQHKTKMEQLFARLLPAAEPPLIAEVALLFEGALISCQLQQSTAPVATARRILERMI